MAKRDPLDNLTPKQKQFVLNLLNGQKLTEAVINTDYETDRPIDTAHQILQSEKVQEAIQRMRKPAKVYGKNRLQNSIDYAIDLYHEIIEDEEDKYPIELRLDCVKDLLDRAGVDFEGTDKEVNLGVGMDGEAGEVAQVLLNMREKEDG